MIKSLRAWISYSLKSGSGDYGHRVSNLWHLSANLSPICWIWGKKSKENYQGPYIYFSNESEDLQ